MVFGHIRDLIDVKQERNQAAVLIAITEAADGQEFVLLTERAKHLSIHSGEVAFPGGKWESEDSSLLDTALRESHEEVGLAPSRVNIIEQLPVSHTRQGISVTPYVGRVESRDGLVANIDELQSLFWVPIDFLLKDIRERTDIFTVEGSEYWSPVYDWMGYTIWGFTARVMVDFLNRVYGQNIQRCSEAPEIPYKQ